jgi:hypothetical protein
MSTADPLGIVGSRYFRSNGRNLNGDTLRMELGRRPSCHGHGNQAVPTCLDYEYVEFVWYLQSFKRIHVN